MDMIRLIDARIDEKIKLILRDPNKMAVLDSTGATPRYRNPVNNLDAAAHALIDHEGLPGIASDFLDLSDAPSSYSGKGGRVVAVKATEDGLEFIVLTGEGGGLVLIDEIILAADSDPIEFTDIPQVFASLYLEVTGRAVAAGTGLTDITAQVGNASFDTGSNYAYRATDSNSSTTSYSDTKIIIARASLPQAGSTAGASGSAKATFFDYTNTNFWKTVRGEGATFHTGANEMRWNYSAGGWKSTSAIERIKLTTAMVQNSVARLWGIPK